MKTCKMCSREVSEKRTYCSNKCKFSDDEYNESRVKHLRKKKVYTFNCPECDWGCNDPENKSGVVTRHFKNEHDMNLEEVMEKYPELDLKLSVRRERKVNADITCKVCNKKFKKLSNTHLAKHGLTPSEYKEKYDVENTAGRGTSKKQRGASLERQIDNIFNGNRLPSSISPLFTRDDYISVEEKYPFQCKSCNNIFEAHLDDGNIPVCKVCNPNMEFGPNGKAQKEIYEFLNSFGHNVIMNDRTVISPKELDFYIPDLNLAIEYHGLYWHGESFKDKYYHIDKLRLCKSRGIGLIQIFEDEWMYNKDIVKSKLRNTLGKTETRVYARKCEVKFLDKKVTSAFLENNHLQGKDIHSHSLGLFYNDDLISVMTFSKPRIALGHNSEENRYELSRFCSKLDTLVVGGASKLLSHFIRETSPDSMYTYADRRWTLPDSSFYETIGFTNEGKTKIGYWYFKRGKYKRFHRFNFTKKKTVELGGDPNKTEWENMKDMGYDRIWDCGNYRYEWKKES